MCYLQNLGSGPLILLTFRCLKAIYHDLYKFCFSPFCNDKDLLFGLQSESELIPTFLAPFLPESHLVPSWSPSPQLGNCCPPAPCRAPAGSPARERSSPVPCGWGPGTALSPHLAQGYWSVAGAMSGTHVPTAGSSSFPTFSSLCSRPTEGLRPKILPSQPARLTRGDQRPRPFSVAGPTPVILAVQVGQMDVSTPSI